MATFTDRLKHAWNAFANEDTEQRIQSYGQYGAAYGSRPDRHLLTAINDKSIINSVYTRIGIDVAANDILHVKLDENKRYSETLDSGLNNCLTLEANIDQGAAAFKQDIVMTMFDKGHVAIVPIDTTLDPNQSTAYDIKTMRVGEIVAWLPRHVRVSLYNEQKGRKEELTLAKDYVAIVENPLYSVMNAPNSTLQRLVRKLAMLDSLDEQASSGKLDIIIQLPYAVKTDARREQAETRRKAIEDQMVGSKYGIAYADSTERITQLNRPAENNMLKQVEYLTEMLYGQLGLTPEVFNGTADAKMMKNYQNRTIKPVLTAITQAMKRTFLTKTARTQLQSIEFFNDPFSMVTIDDMADVADKMTRNEIMTSNEVRTALGMRPVKDPSADELRNKNIPAPVDPTAPPTTDTAPGDPPPTAQEPPVDIQAQAEALLPTRFRSAK